MSPDGSVISNGPKGTGKHGYKMVTETKGVVNGYEGPRSSHPELDNVNNCTESLSMECCQPKSVNNHESGVEVEDDFEGICDLFD